jgi:polar amino acid transport system substrate-binding protein
MRIFLLILAFSAIGHTQEVVRVGAKLFEPSVIKEGPVYSGFEYELMQHVAQHLNWEVEYTPVVGVSNALAMVDEGVDIAIGGISKTVERNNKYGFSESVVPAGLVVLMPREDQSSVWRATQDFVEKGAWIWVLLMLTWILLAGHIIWISEWGSQEIRNTYSKDGIGQAIWLAFATGTTIGYGDVTPKTTLGRTTAFVVWLSFTIFVGFALAEINSSLVVQKLDSAQLKLGELQGKTIATIKNSTSVQAIQNLEGVGLELETIEDAYKLLEAKQVHAIIYDAPVLKHFVANQGQEKFSVVSPPFALQDYAWVFAPGDSRISQVNAALLYLKETGVYEQLYTKYFN